MEYLSIQQIHTLADTIFKLQSYSEDTGVITRKSQGELLKNLTPDEAAEVLGIVTVKLDTRRRVIAALSGKLSGEAV